METMFTIGKGDNKRQVTAAQLDERNLNWYADECRSERMREAAQAERRKRQGGNAAAGSSQPQQRQAPPAQRAPQTGIQKASSGSELSLEKAIHEPTLVTQRLRDFSEQFHLVSPATSVDALPPGCGVAISMVHVNPDPGSNGPKEVYEVGGRLGLSGDTLKRIAAAAAISWDPTQSGRLDDGSDPHYCHYRAVGSVRNFDGSIRVLTGEVEMDARDGSPQIDEIRTKAKKKGGDGASQILELRKFLLRHAESKAKNRAIADMGVKRSYAKHELNKPFAVARIMWTGETDDPELKREFARMHAERMLDGAASLYGRGAAPALAPRRVEQQEPRLPSFQGHNPPPIGTVAESLDEPGGYDYDAPEFDESPAAQTSPATATPLPQQKLEGLPADQDRGADPNKY